MNIPRRPGFALLTGFCAVVGMTGAAFGQNAATDAQNKLLARRAAEADCYRKLAEAVYGLKLNSNTTVRDFVTESDEIRTNVEAFVRGVRLGQPRYYEDGACEVEGEVTVAKLVTKLTEVHKEHYKGNTVTTQDISHLQESVKSDVITAIGSGAPRPELPPDLPAGVEQVITPLPQGYAPPTTIAVPGIWKTAGPQARLMAQRAARVDAMRKLLEQIKGLRLSSNTTVRDFITESDEIITNAEGIVVGASEVGTYLHEDELIVEVTMEVPVEKLVTKLTELHKEHYKGNTVTTTDITNLKQFVQREMIRASGAGVPPPQFIKQAESAGASMPEWFGGQIEATGQGTDPAITTAQGRLKAARAARADALRRLAEQIYGLRLDSSTTVQDFVTQNDMIRTQVDAVISGATEKEVKFEGDIAHVTMVIPAAEVWGVVNDQMIHQRRQG